MTENKQVQIIIRTTQEEKAIITQKAKDKGVSVNEFIKRIILEDDIKEDINDNINDGCFIGFTGRLVCVLCPSRMARTIGAEKRMGRSRV